MEVRFVYLEKITLHRGQRDYETSSTWDVHLLEGNKLTTRIDHFSTEEEAQSLCDKLNGVGEGTK